MLKYGILAVLKWTLTRPNPSNVAVNAFLFNFSLLPISSSLGVQSRDGVHNQ